MTSSSRPGDSAGGRLTAESTPLAQLNRAAPAVLPSMLLCDFGNLEREVHSLEQAEVPGLHLDVMDGQFVPNFTYGMTIVSALRKLTRLPLDVHLMMVEPGRYLSQFRDAGADLISIHVEASADPGRDLTAIRELGLPAGLAINPSTPLERLDPFLDACDYVLVMSVEAGFGGQAFNPLALERLRALRARLGEDFPLEVDGGVNRKTMRACAEAGARWFVVGSAIFSQPEYARAVRELRSLAVT